MGAPTVMLLHGLAATGRLNWFTALPALSERFRVIVVDHRGHGRGIRTPHFRLADCADDVAAVADHLGIESFIAVGYSMGGPIAKLCWSRHRDRVRGLVLCATANHFLRPEAQGAASAVFPGMVVAARLMPRFFMDRIIDGMTRGIPAGDRRDRVRREMEPSDPATVLQAARAVIRFSSHDWAAGIDVPTAVVITTQDQLVPPRRHTASRRQFRARRSSRWPVITSRACGPPVDSSRRWSKPASTSTPRLLLARSPPERSPRRATRAARPSQS